MNIMRNEEYNTLDSAYKRGLEAENKTIGELKAGSKDNAKGKGNMGDAFEKWFGKPQDNKSEPDLMPAHVELKTTPFRKLKRPTKKGYRYSAKERLVFDMINYFKLVKEDFYHSRFLYKDKNILLAFYRYMGPGKENKAKQKIYKVVLLRMLKNPSDLGVIRHDWDTIQAYVEHGDADKLSERKTQYLGACTKGRNGRSLCKQPYSHNLAKRRAFDFKSGYMTQMLRTYIIHPDKKSPSIFHGTTPPKSIDLKSVILHRLNSEYAGRSNKELAKEFHIPLIHKGRNGQNTSKGLNYQIISAIFHISDNPNKKNDGLGYADELQKARIIPKTVQFNYNNTNKESMSFPAFSFSKMNKETWHHSHLYDKLYENTFLFCVFKDKRHESKPKPENSVFLGATMYQFPLDVIEKGVEPVWKDTRDKVSNGTLTLKCCKDNSKSGFHIDNNFIENNKAYRKKGYVMHVRPHTSYRSYKPSSYSEYIPGGVKWINRPSDHDDYTNHYMTKQCFFLNNHFIKKICTDKGLLK